MSHGTRRCFARNPNKESFFIVTFVISVPTLSTVEASKEVPSVSQAEPGEKTKRKCERIDVSGCRMAEKTVMSFTRPHVHDGW